MASRARSYVSENDFIKGIASVALVGGDLVYLSNTGTLVKASMGGVQAGGIVLDDIPLGSVGHAYTEATLSDATGLTPGTRYYLVTGGGYVSTIGSVTAGNQLQCVGVAVSPTEIKFKLEPSPIVIQAAATSVMTAS